ncbi:MAG: hypothetical protein ACFCUN_01100 [Hyphomicrobiaceae bacterium]
MSEFADQTSRKSGADPTSCEAPELKALIAQLASQMAAAETRNARALDLIQDQLSQLSAKSQGARRSVPSHFATAFDKLEDAIADLARRVATAPRDAIEQPSHLQDTSSGLRGGVDSGGNPSSSTDRPAMAAASPGPAASQATVAPVVAVEPTAGYPGISAREEIGPGPQLGVAAAPIGFVEPAPQPVEEIPGTWDSDAAEALTRIYEHHASDLAPQGVPVDDDTIVAEAARMLASTANPIKAQLADNDRSWLDSRFADIAAEVASRLTPAVSEVSLDEISMRLADVEARMQSAFTDMVTRDDLSALPAIEQYLAEITNQFEASRQELDRVATIEQEVISLAERFSDERLAALARPLPTDANIDVALLADAVAARLAEAGNDPDGSAAPSEAERSVYEIRELVQSIVERQQSGGAQTNAMLDTMQQAMIRLLDRMDAIEHAQLALVDKVRATPDRGGPDRGTAAMAPGPASAQTDRANERAAAPSPGQDRPTMQGMQPRNITRQGGGDDGIPRVQRQAAPNLGNPQHAQPMMQAAAPGQSAPAQGTREAFIESARRAAQRAAERGPELTSSPSHIGSTAPISAPPRDDDEAEASTSSGTRARLWVAGLALTILAAGVGTYVMLPKGGEAPMARQLITPETLERERLEPRHDGDAQPVQQAGDRESRLDDPQAREFAALNGETAAYAASSQITPPLVTGATTQQAALAPDFAAARTTDATPLTGTALVPPAQIGPASLRTAATNGNASAEFEVGSRYAEGRGIDQDFKLAAQWYGRAAEKGFALAQYRLATLYERGLGVPRDLNAAKLWYMKAADQGTVKAMHNLAVLTAGQSTPDYRSAAIWFRRAAELGLSDSQFNIAILHQNGLGVAKDASEAYRWFSLAAKAGDTEANTQAKALRGQVEANRRGQIDGEVEAWQPAPYVPLANDPAVAGQAWQAGAQGT